MIEKDFKENTPTAAGGDSRATCRQPEWDARDIGNAPTCFIKSEYLTVDITNGKKASLEELRKRFPRIEIFNLRHLVLFGNNISIYRLDRQLGVTK